MLPNQVVTIIQARTGSSRLPNKVLQPVLDRPMLVHQVHRVQAAKRTGQVVVATTYQPEDDIIEALCRKEGFLYYRGHPTDLLDRHYQAGRHFSANVVVKIPSDCPLIDPCVVDRVLAFFQANVGRYDFVSNLHPPTYPDGNDVEVMTMDALTAAWREAEREFEREHTTPYLWENPTRFRLGNVVWETGLNYAMSHRWTVDYVADLHFVRAVYEALYPQNHLFSLSDILDLLDRQPDIAGLNERYAGVNWYRHHLGELRTISAAQTHLFNEESVMGI